MKEEEATEVAEAATEVAEAIELKAKKEMKVATEEVVTEEAAKEEMITMKDKKEMPKLMDKKDTEVDTVAVEEEVEPNTDLELLKVLKDKPKGLRVMFNITMVIREKLTDMKVNQGKNITNMTEEMELEEVERVQERKVTEEETGEAIDRLTRREEMMPKEVKSKRQKNSQIPNKLPEKLKVRNQEKKEEEETMTERVKEETMRKLLKKK